MIRVIKGAGNDAALRSAKSIEPNFRTGIAAGFYFIGKDHKKQMQDNMTKEKKTGVLLRRRGRKRRSAPNESPANITGKLYRSIDYNVSTDQLEFGYNESVSYGGFLENGTRRMDKRPNIVRVANRSGGSVEEIMRSHIKQRIWNAE